MAYPARLRARPRAPGAVLGAALGAWLVAACHGRAADEIVREPGSALDEFSVTLDAEAPGTPVNRLLLGSNVQWVDRGDDLLDDGGRLRPDMLAAVLAMRPGILRYPGGSQADTYHWERGLGVPGARGENEHFHSKRLQSTLMGTQEFLELCEAAGAAALITVNLASGGAEEAAGWVRLTNRQGLVSRRTGARLPPVKYWELGNEPYLKDDAQPQLWLTPQEFARRAQAFALAMRAVDPDIVLLLPLTNDTRNGFPATPYPGFTRTVLDDFTAPIDLISLHNAYLPFAMEREHSRAALYWGAMGASRTVLADFAAMRALLHTLRPAAHWRFALTEYNAIFTLGRGASDDLVASPVAALYVADLLRVLAGMPDLALANYWSLSGNWRFGAVRSDGAPRPAMAVLALYNELLQGAMVSVDMHSQTVDTPSVGGSAAVRGLNLVEALATRHDRTLRLLLIHKDEIRAGHGLVHLRHAQVAAAHLTVLGWQDPWAVDAADQPSSRPLPAGPDIGVDLPPHSLALLTVDLAT